MDELRKYFDENFSLRNELGAGVSVWQNGEEILSLADGFCERERRRAWTKNTIIPVYSATKGPAAATLLHVLETKGLGISTSVSEVWRNFPVKNATFSDLLSHQCGLAALGEGADVFDYDNVINAIEGTIPEWLPGQGLGYHPRTFGFLLDECVRQLTGQALGEVWRIKIAEPLGIDFWIGLPETEWNRVAHLVPGKATQNQTDQEFYAEFSKPGSLTRRAFSSPRGLHAVSEMNEARTWAAGLPAMGGVGSASGLAKFYQVAIGAIPSMLSGNTSSALGSLVTQKRDKVLLREMAFTNGCQMDPLDEAGQKSRSLFGSLAKCIRASGSWRKPWLRRS